MNDRDVLKRASEALRETTEPSAAELAALRARVLSKKIRPLAPKQRGNSLRWVLPLAAAFVAGSALAATPGAWQGMLDTVERFLRIELLSPVREAAHPVPKRAREQRQQPPLVAPAALPEAVPEPAALLAAESKEAEAAQPAPRPAEAPAARARSTRVAQPSAAASSERAPKPAPAVALAPVVAPAPAVAPAPSEDLLLYKQAHELHFRGHRYAEALAAWNAYLSRLPDGTLAFEARYNRALCLIRLGRYAEARAALAPFAEGKLGNGYRRSEAARFLQAMEKVP